MPSFPPVPLPRRPASALSGQVLFDALMALLLLATLLLGTGMTLVRSIAANRATALHTSAVDLIADLTEGLQQASSASERQSLLGAWGDRVAASLPDGLAVADLADGAPGATARLEIRLHWRDHADGHNAALQLPVLLTPVR